jgi:pilus assembly protein CpaC
MHRTLFWFRGLLGGALLALVLGGLPGVGRAQNQGVAGAAIYVPTGGTIRLQMKDKRPIKRVSNPRDAVLSIRTVFGDPTTILLTGQQSDVTRIELEDETGTKETYEVIVQRDIENLRTQLHRAAPTASIVPTPISDSTVVLNGTVTNAEDVDVLTNVARSLGFQVINAMRVGGVQQVQLDVVIVQVSRSDLRTLTFNFIAQSPNFFFAHNVGSALSTISGIGPINFGGRAAGAAGTANIVTGVVHNSWSFLAFIDALRSESIAKFLATPHQVTLSGRPSNFHSGGQQAIPSGGGINGVGAQFVPFGTDINFLPIVLGNGKIYLEVDAHVDELAASSINIAGANVANRTSNSVTTSVELESGQTFVLGGITTHTVQGSTDKIPVLGDVPFFGVFFSSKSFNESEEEVMIIVTPHLVDAQDCGQVAKILPGQETRRPDDFELFLEGILEAPRGQREVFQGNHFVPAYKSGPSADQFPCATNDCCGRSGNKGVCNGGNSGCGAAGCAAGCDSGCKGGGCNGGPVTAPAAPPAPGTLPSVTGKMDKMDDARPLPMPAPETTATKDANPDATDRPLNLPPSVAPKGERPEKPDDQ